MKNGWSPSWTVLWRTAAFLKLFFILFRRTSLLKEKMDIDCLSSSARQYKIYCLIPFFSMLKTFSWISVPEMRKSWLYPHLPWPKYPENKSIIFFYCIPSPAQYYNPYVRSRCQNFFYHIFLLTLKLFPLAFCTYFFNLHAYITASCGCSTEDQMPCALTKSCIIWVWKKCNFMLSAQLYCFVSGLRLVARITYKRKNQSLVWKKNR